jgi:hypothetical protein
LEKAVFKHTEQPTNKGKKTMKKTMLALMATVGLAFGAKADPLNSTGFEGLSTFDIKTLVEYPGTEKEGLYWAVTNPSADLTQTVVAEYGESATPESVPDAFTNAANSAYLKVDTGADVLYRSVAKAALVDEETGMPLLNAGTAIGKGLYFDANVQFTASDGEPTYDSADKLVVWLKATEGENPTTNLVVTAGVWNNVEGKYEPYDFEIDGTYSADTWYRLTVKAMIDDGLTKFVVYVDDEQLKVGGTAAVFNSLVQTGDNKATLTAVGFQGTGAVDNLVWTTEDPFPVVPPTTVALTVALTDDAGVFNSLTAQVGDAVAADVVVPGPAPIVAAVDNVITFVAKVYAGYTPAVTGYDVDKSVDPIEIDEPGDGYAYTFTVKVTQAMIDDGLTLTIKVTEDGGEEVPTEDVTPAGGGTTKVQAADADAAKAAVTAQGVDGTVYPASQKYYTKKAVDNGDGTFTVTLSLDKDTLEADVDDAVEAALEAVVGDAETKAVAIPAGFYYQIEYGTTVDLASKPMTGTSTGSVTMPELGENAGFFKVSVDTTSFEE